MNLLDLVAFVSVLATIGTIVSIGVLLIRKRMAAARTTSIWLTVFLASYAGTLVTVSLISPGKVLAIGDTRCWDEWCMTVTGASKQTRIGDLRAGGIFYVVALRINNRSQGRRQREINVCTALADGRGERFDESSVGQEALQRAGLAGSPVTSFVDAGGSFESRLVYDVPVEATGVGFVRRNCGRFGNPIIGDPGSFLHRPTIVRLQSS
jgi:hypothetical protein